MSSEIGARVTRRHDRYPGTVIAVHDDASIDVQWDHHPAGQPDRGYADYELLPSSEPAQGLHKAAIIAALEKQKRIAIAAYDEAVKRHDELAARYHTGEWDAWTAAISVVHLTQDGEA